MKSYASSLVLHILSLVLLAASGVYAAMHGLWFCTAASAGVIAGIGISLYRMQTRQVQTMKRIVDCMKNNDLATGLPCLQRQEHADAGRGSFCRPENNPHAFE